MVLILFYLNIKIFDYTLFFQKQIMRLLHTKIAFQYIAFYLILQSITIDCIYSFGNGAKSKCQDYYSYGEETPSLDSSQDLSTTFSQNGNKISFSTIRALSTGDNQDYAIKFVRIIYSLSFIRIPILMLSTLMLRHLLLLGTVVMQGDPFK